MNISPHIFINALLLSTTLRINLILRAKVNTIRKEKDKFFEYVLIDSGKVVGEGTHNELLEKSSVYKNFYDKQIRKE